MSDYCPRGHDLAVHGRARPDRPAGNIHCHTCKLEYNRQRYADRKLGKVQPRAPKRRKRVEQEEGRYQVSEYWLEEIPTNEPRCKACREPLSWCICN